MNLRVTTITKTADSTTKTYIYMKTTQDFLDCKDEVDKICKSIKRLLDNVDKTLKEIIISDPAGKLVEQYKYCLKHTVLVALDDVDTLIEKYHITNETEVGLLRNPIINLMDGAEELFNQG